MLINIQSIRSKKESFWQLIDQHNPDIIFGCETWLTKSVYDNEVLPSFYKLYRNDRSDGYGGVLLGIKLELPSYLIDVQSHIETCSVSVQLANNQQMILVCAYRAPNTDDVYQDNLCNYIIDLATKYPNSAIYCAGDFNLPDIDWSNNSISGHRYSSTINDLALSMMAECGFSQVVNFPTRLNNTLDILFTNRPSLIQHCFPAPGISDHSIVLATTVSKITYQKSNSYKMYLWNRANVEDMKYCMSNFMTEFCHSYTIESPVELLWSSISGKLLYLLDTFVPSKHSPTNTSQPWITRSIKQLRRQKQRSYNRAVSTNLPVHWQAFKELKRKMQKECRRAFNRYMFNSIHDPYLSGRRKKLYRHIKSLRSDQCGISTLMDNGTCYTDNQAKADILNKYFSSVFTTDDDSPLPDLGTSMYPDASAIEIGISGITKLLNELDPSKSPGPDKIPPRLLKLLADEVSPCLQLLFSASLHQGILPTDWKKATVCPIFKKGDRKNPANYRPVSLTSICSKVMEHVIYSNIMCHLEANNILSPEQFGFRKDHSAELQLLQTVHDLALILNNGSQCDVALLDFSKAFDRVSHRHLLLKLDHYGIRNSTLNWISSFLRSRTQQVVCGGCYSNSAEVLSGVPQGTVLGPLLFLLYVNDIPSQMKSSCRLYADDCILYKEIVTQDDSRILQYDLQVLEDWERKWKMSLNIDKCVVLTVTLKCNPITSQYTLHGHQLASVNSAKYLGVIIDSKLSFNEHVDSTCKKANSALAFLRRNFRSCQRKIKTDLYFTYVKPLLEYAVTVWAPHTRRANNKLESIQRRAARFVMSDYSRTSSVTDMINTLKWTSIEIRNKELRLITFYKIIHGCVNLPLPNYIHHPSRTTRGNHLKYVQPFTRVDAYKYSFYPSVICQWNNLPNQIASARNFDYFKLLLTDYL